MHCRAMRKRRYKRRNRIERLSGRLKDWRRVATRHDRSPTVFLSAIARALFVARPTLCCRLRHASDRLPSRALQDFCIKCLSVLNGQCIVETDLSFAWGYGHFPRPPPLSRRCRRSPTLTCWTVTFRMRYAGDRRQVVWRLNDRSPTNHRYVLPRGA